VNSTPTPKEGNAQEAADAQVGRTDERLAHAYEEIKRADEQLTQMSERLAKIEGGATSPPSAGIVSQGSGPQGSGPQEPATQSPSAEPPAAHVSPEEIPPPQVSPAKPASRSPIALLLAAGFVVTALVLSAYGGGIVTRWAPQLGSTRSPAEGPALAAQSAPSIVQVASAETTPLPATPEATPPQTTQPQATTLAQAQTAPQDAAPPAVAPPAATTPAVTAPPDQAQLLQKIARDLAALERNIEQLRANQQQMASDNSKAIGELKASQEEMKRTLAKASEPTPPKASVPAAQPAPVVRRPERTYQPPQARARPRYYPRGEWYYDDW
jgi:hypothetical protein